MLRTLHILPWIGSFVLLAESLRPEATGGISVKPDAHMQFSQGSGGSLLETSANRTPSQAPVQANDTKPPSSPQKPTQRRTNMCSRLKQVDSILQVGNSSGGAPMKKKDLLDALRGKKITAVTRKGANSFVSLKGGKWAGYDVEILKELANRAGFEYEIYDDTPQKDLVGDPEGEDEWLRDAVRKYDIVLDRRARTSAHEKDLIVLDYAFVDTSLVLMTSSQQEVGGSIFATLLSPYDWQTWCAFWLITFLTCAVYYYLERPVDKPGIETEVPDCKASYLGTVYVSGMQLATIGSFSPTTRGGTFVTLSWSLFCLIFVSGYTANLASCLVYTKKTSALWLSLDEAVAADARICIDKSIDYLDENFPQYGKAVKTVEKYASQGTQTSAKHKWEGAISAMVDGKCDATIGWKANFDIAVEKQDLNPDCNLMTVGPPLTYNFGGWLSLADYGGPGGLCTGLIRDSLHLHFTLMKDDGTLDKIYNTHLLKMQRTRKKSCALSASSSSETSLTIEAMAGLFIFQLIMIIGTAIAHVVYAHKEVALAPVRTVARAGTHLLESAAAGDENIAPDADTAGSSMQAMAPATPQPEPSPASEAF